jgi:hypothetical protein
MISVIGTFYYLKIVYLFKLKRFIFYLLKVMGLMEKKNFKIKAIIYTIIFQLIIIFLVFLGGLLDPLLGIIVVAINFFIINTFFVFKYFNHNQINNI